MRLINHKYLKEIDVTPVQYSYKEFPGIFQKIKGWIKCRKYQRAQIRTGFNPAETWDLEQSFYQWLYEGLRSYMDYASKVIDLDLDAEWLSLEYMGKSYTQRQLTELLLEKLEFVLRSDKDQQYVLSAQELSDEYGKRKKTRNEIHDMWKILAPRAGW